MDRIQKNIMTSSPIRPSPVTLELIEKNKINPFKHYLICFSKVVHFLHPV